MIDPTASLSAAGGIARTSGLPAAARAAQPAGPGFADTLKNVVGEVARLQQDATHAVEDLAADRTDDVAGVMTAVEKSDLAFKTLLAVRGKLMDAYDEIRNMQI